MLIQVGTLSRLSPEEFAWMAIQLAKLEVSPAVRLVAIAGRDGGRDAVLDGPCVSGRSDWTGRWVFQFKHYRSDVAVARRRVVTDFRDELVNLRRNGVVLDNYVWITSVPFSGDPQAGTHARMAKVIADLDYPGLRIDIWDGHEVVALLHRHPRVKEAFFDPDFASTARPVASGAIEELAALSDERSDGQDDEAFGFVLSLLLGRGPFVMSPAAESGLWRAYTSDDYGVAYRQMWSLLRRGRRRQQLPPEGRRAIAWIALATAAIAARRGEARRALWLVQGIPAAARTGDAELDAWCWNVSAIAHGKLDRATAHAKATLQAVSRADAAGAEWLRATIALRAAHKASWKAGETGEPLTNDAFLETLSASRGKGSASMATRDRLHVDAQSEAYLALQFAWHEVSRSDAQRSLFVATAQFTELADASELARLTSERGRLVLKSGEGEKDAIQQFRHGLAQRVRTGDIARARYDLLWLAQAYGRLGDEQLAEVCAWTVLALHAQLYGSHRVDAPLLAEAEQVVRNSGSHLVRIATRRRFAADELIAMLHTATGLSETALVALVELDRLRRLIAQSD